jgi:hypothetical protein
MKFKQPFINFLIKLLMVISGITILSLVIYLGVNYPLYLLIIMLTIVSIFIFLFILINILDALDRQVLIRDRHKYTYWKLLKMWFNDNIYGN